MTPPIDYSKWDNIDTDSDADSEIISSGKDKQRLDSTPPPNLLNRNCSHPTDEDSNHESVSKMRTDDARSRIVEPLRSNAQPTRSNNHHRPDTPNDADDATQSALTFQRFLRETGLDALQVGTPYEKIIDGLNQRGWPDLASLVIDMREQGHLGPAKKEMKTSGNDPHLFAQLAHQPDFCKLASRPWTDRNTFLNVMTNTRGADGRPLYSRAEVLEIMGKIETVHKQSYEIKLQETPGYRAVSDRIDLNHGGTMLTKLQHQSGSLLAAGPDDLFYSWSLDPQGMVTMDRSEQQRMRATKQGIRDFSLVDLKLEWDNVIKRIKKHLSDLTTTSTDTKLEAFVRRISQLLRGTEDDFYHIFRAMQFAVLMHNDFTVFKDDFEILNDPRAVCATTTHKSCIDTVIFMGILTAPADTKFIVKLHGDMPSWQHLTGRAHIVTIDPRSLRGRILRMYTNLMATGKDGLTILMVYISDQNPDTGTFWTTATLCHRITLAIGPQGVAILQSYILNKFAMGLHEWVEKDHGRVRTWPEFQTWLNAFEVATTGAPNWDSDRNEAWKYCFSVDVREVVSSHPRGALRLKDTWSPLVGIHEIPDVQVQNFDKFTWKLGTYRDTQGWAKLAKHMAAYPKARPEHVIKGWMPILYED